MGNRPQDMNVDGEYAWQKNMSVKRIPTKFYPLFERLNHTFRSVL